MENLHLEGSPTLPEIEMNLEGIIKFSGRALPEDAIRYFQPILEWAKNYEGDILDIDMNLEYFNTSVSKQLHDFLEILNDKAENCKIKLVWQYEEGDDEMLESGEIYMELFPRIEFSFNEYEEIIE